MRIYHSTDENLTDGQAQKVMQASLSTVRNAGGTLTVSRSFHHGPAILVLILPDEVSTETVLPGMGFEEVQNGTTEQA